MKMKVIFYFVKLDGLITLFLYLKKCYSKTKKIKISKGEKSPLKLFIL